VASETRAETIAATRAVVRPGLRVMREVSSGRGF